MTTEEEFLKLVKLFGENPRDKKLNRTLINELLRRNLSEGPEQELINELTIENTILKEKEVRYYEWRDKEISDLKEYSLDRIDPFWGLDELRENLRDSILICNREVDIQWAYDKYVYNLINFHDLAVELYALVHTEEE